MPTVDKLEDENVLTHIINDTMQTYGSYGAANHLYSSLNLISNSSLLVLLQA